MNPLVLFLLFLEALFALVLLKSSDNLRSWRSWVVSITLLLGAFALRAAFMSYETLDYQDFLKHWVEYFRTHGGFAALRYPIGNYNIPYLYFLALFSYADIYDLYLIKLLSIFFDVLLAYAAMQLLGKLSESVPARLGLFFAVLFYPTVVLNGAVWGQCDSTYAALILLGLYFALDDRPVLSVLFAALSFGFKLQAVFVLPVWAVLLFAKKVKLRELLLFPVFYVLLVLPAVLLGRPFWDTVMLYFNQTGSIGDGLNYNSSSIFAALGHVADPALASKVAIVGAFAFMLVILGVCFFARERLNDRAILAAAVLLAVGIPFLLPHMHDRYFFCADILTLILAFVSPAHALAAPLTEYASLLGYHAYLKMRFLHPMRYGAYALTLTLLLALVHFVQTLFLTEEAPGEHERKTE